MQKAKEKPDKEKEPCDWIFDEEEWGDYFDPEEIYHDCWNCLRDRERTCPFDIYDDTVVKFY